MEIQRSFVGASLLLVGLLAWAPAVSAQSASGDKEGSGKTGASTVVLKFQKRKVSQDVMDTFYRSLNKVIKQSDDMHVVSGGDMTIDDLIVTAGCQEPNEECLSGVSKYIDADRMVFGSIKRSGEAYLFTFKMFDFVEERFVRTVSEQTVEGDEATVKTAVPAIAEAFMYGDVGEMKVSAQGAEGDARIYFDGEKMGLAPTTLKNLPLGQHAVSVRTGDDEEKTKLVVLREGESKSVEFDFGGGGGGMAGGGGGNPPILGYSAAGAGLAGLIVGIVGHAQNASALQAERDLMCGDSLCNPEDIDRARELQEKNEDRLPRTGTMAVVGYSIGAIGLGAGGYLLYRHFSGSPATSESPSALQSIQIQPTRRGVELGVSLEF